MVVVVIAVVLGQNVTGQNVMDKMSWTKCHGQNVMRIKCHGTKCHEQNDRIRVRVKYFVHGILSVTFCPVTFCPPDILSVTFCP